jgi:short-subunit dehydrogenase
MDCRLALVTGASAGIGAAEAGRPVCVPGAPNKAGAALAKLVPEEWTLALVAWQGPKFRKA